MSDLSCRTVRRWLQEPDSLALIDARHMDRHLAHCAECSAYRTQQIRMDALILRALDTGVGTTSVRQAVGARLREEQRAPAPPVRRSPLAPLRSLLRPASVLVPVAVAAAVVLALFQPQLFNKQGSVTPASAAWHVRRPSIGYPLTLDPHRPNHLLVGAWGQIYQSWDAGRSWQQLGGLPSGLIIRDLAVDASNPNRYLVAAQHSVYVSDNAGRSWALRVSDLLGAENMFIVQDPRRPQNFYVGPSVLWKSADSGRTWYRDGRGTVFGPDGIQSLAVAGNGDLYTGIWAGGVAVSHDGGVTWHRRAHGLAKDVLSVSIGPANHLWAATDRGTFMSADNGASWQRLSPSHFFATAVADTGSYLLAGGDGALYRSLDTGRHWSRAQDGLPLDPYVYSLLIDPRQPERVYASLDGDGIFRSDDGGQTWQDLNAGLPISLQEGKSDLVLFRRHGVLWKTNSRGADPGNLTIDSSVRRAALSPDGVTAAYITGTSAHWSLRAVSAGGSLAETLLDGTGPLPSRLIWSPTGSRIALVDAHSATVVSLAGDKSTWTIPATSQVLGWTRDGQALLTWDAVTRLVQSRAIQSGRVLGRWAGSYPGLPLRAAGTTSIAMVHGPKLSIGTIGGSARVVAQVPSCRLTSWSDDGSRLLLACRNGEQIRSRTGRLIAGVPAPANARWAPGLDGTLLYFRHGSLWSWTSAGGAHVIVPDASSAR